MRSSQAGAILRAQWRVMWRPSQGRGGRVLGVALALLWYSIWAGFAVAGYLLTVPASRSALLTALPWTLGAIAAYWQLAPVLTVSLGAALDLKKLLIYPVPDSQLFLIEVLLRLTTGLEMLIVLTGISAGLLGNRAVPIWGPLVAMPVFVVFNLLVAAGLRSLLERLLAHKRIREVLVVLLVLGAGLPQLLAYRAMRGINRAFWAHAPQAFWPWSAAAGLALGESIAAGFLVLCAWTVAAYWFGRWQFRRSLSFDAAEVRPSVMPAMRTRRAELLYRIPGWFFSDPLAAVMEKELRSLCRSPRFRLLFLMGFSFGLMIWLPFLRTQAGESTAGENYPVIVSVYALVLLAEVVFWNVFGFDRSAAQLYFSAPVPFSRIILGKNLAAAAFVLLEITIITVVCTALGLPLRAAKVVETYSVALVSCFYMMAAGNLTSLYYPRAVNPEHSWGRSSRRGNFQLVLLVLFPVLALPVALAYLARYAFASQAAFYIVLAFAAVLGAGVYHIAMDSALSAAEQRKEQFLAGLGEAAGPISGE